MSVVVCVFGEHGVCSLTDAYHYRHTDVQITETKKCVELVFERPDLSNKVYTGL